MSKYTESTLITSIEKAKLYLNKPDSNRVSFKVVDYRSHQVYNDLPKFVKICLGTGGSNLDFSIICTIDDPDHLLFIVNLRSIDNGSCILNIARIISAIEKKQSDIAINIFLENFVGFLGYSGISWSTNKINTQLKPTVTFRDFNIKEVVQ